MKLKIVSVMAAVGLATSVFGQGVILQNIGNSGAAGAPNNGLVYIDMGTGPVLWDGFNRNLGVVVSGGVDAGSLQPMGTFTAATDSKGYTGINVGKFQLGPSGAGVLVPGVAAGGTATIMLQMWDDGAGGLYPSFAAAQAPGAGYWAAVTFQNPTSNPGAVPPVPDQALTGMPSVTLLQTPGIPEPSTIVLAGLGLAGLLLRRRK